MLVRWVRQMKYGLKMEIVQHSNLCVTLLENSCQQLNIKVVVVFTGRLEIRPSKIFESDVNLSIDNLRKGISHENIQLRWDNSPTVRGFSLKNGDTTEREYLFTTRRSENLHLGKQVRCQLTIGYVYLHKVSNELMMRQFKVMVVNNAET